MNELYSIPSCSNTIETFQSQVGSTLAPVYYRKLDKDSLQQMKQSNNQTFFRKIWNGIGVFLEWLFCCGSYAKDKVKKEGLNWEKAKNGVKELLKGVSRDYEKLYILIHFDKEVIKYFLKSGYKNDVLSIVDKRFENNPPKKDFSLFVFSLAEGKNVECHHFAITKTKAYTTETGEDGFIVGPTKERVNYKPDANALKNEAYLSASGSPLWWESLNQ